MSADSPRRRRLLRRRTALYSTGIMHSRLPSLAKTSSPTCQRRHSQHLPTTPFDGLLSELTRLQCSAYCRGTFRKKLEPNSSPEKKLVLGKSSRTFFALDLRKSFFEPTFAPFPFTQAFLFCQEEFPAIRRENCFPVFLFTEP